MDLIWPQVANIIRYIGKNSHSESLNADKITILNLGW